MPKRYLSVSIMCSDQLNLAKEIDLLKRYSTDALHVDVMDGHFVPNLTFGVPDIIALQRGTDLPLDIHLMVTDPCIVLDKISLRRGDAITVHSELPLDFAALSSRVHDAGCLFGIALNPDTPADALEPYAGLYDFVLLMLVHPGFAGAKMVPGIMDKVGATRAWLDAKGLQDVKISVDGSVSRERAAYMAGLGADVFVGGTAGIYIKGRNISETIPEFKNTIDNE